MNPKVSIVIPTYNRGKFIAECLESAMSSRYVPLEIIVTDNASQDDTISVARRISNGDPRVIIVENSENSGPVQNWRKGADLASGEFIKILFSDDLMHRDFITKAVDLIQSDSSIGFVYSSVELIGGAQGTLYNNWATENSEFQPDKNRGICSTSQYWREIICGGNVPCSPGCALMRRSDFLKHLDTSFDHCKWRDFGQHGAGSDLGVFLGLATEYSKFGYLSETLNYFRHHEGSITIADINSNQRLCISRMQAVMISRAVRSYGSLIGLILASIFFYRTPKKIRNQPSLFFSTLGIERIPWGAFCRMKLGILLRKMVKNKAWFWKLITTAPHIH